jgi:hypothetical protein
MNKLTYLYLAIASLLLINCDDGDIQDKIYTAETGLYAEINGNITGLKNWNEDFSVAIAGFDDESNYAIISKVVSGEYSQDGAQVISLSNIPLNVKTIELCVINRLRQKVFSFHSTDVEGIRDTVRIDIDSMNVSMHSSIQKSLFNTTCIQCHGGSTFAAAGLYLTEGKSYEAMVGQPSKKIAGCNIVQPMSADSSVLHMVLGTDSTASWRMSHVAMVSDNKLLNLVDNWINSGAPE